MNLGGAVKLNKKGWLCVVAIALLLLFAYRSISSHLSGASVLGRNAGSTRTSASADEKYVSAAALLAAAVSAAEAGGEIVASMGVGGVRSKGKTAEGADELVTDADFASHCAMTSTLRALLPGVRVASEESTDPRRCESKENAERSAEEVAGLDEAVRKDDVVVWIDPLDATQEFTEGLLNCVTTMVCVTVQGRPVAGVIREPFAKRTTWAWKSKALSDNLKSSKDNTASNRPPTLVVSRSHKGEVDNFTSKAFGRDYRVESTGGAGHKTLMLIDGEADAYVHVTKIKLWDICAGDAILRAVGGNMTTLHGASIDYSNVNKPVNENGLLASLKNHDFYVESVKNAKA